MDKITVDLDQVLNDFEYSELTDQYQSDTSTKETYSNSANILRENVGKHSINNVFHSLNEYLNTNITTVESSDNKINNDGEQCSISSENKSINEFKTESVPNPENVEIEDPSKNSWKFSSSENVCIQEPTKADGIESDLVGYSTLRSEECVEDKDNIYVNEIKTINPVNESALINKTEIALPHEDRLNIDGGIEYPTIENEIEKSLDLHTELQNVGSNFGIGYEPNLMKTSLDESELKTVIGFDQEIYLNGEEMSRLLSELEEDDELAVEYPVEFQSISAFNDGCKNSQDSGNFLIISGTEEGKELACLSKENVMGKLILCNS